LLTNEIKSILLPVVNKKLLIITIGNTFRSDDGVGPYIFDNIRDDINNIDLINAGDKPENVIDEAVSIMPDKTVIIDAANFNGYPGEIRVIPKEYIPDSTLSTHTFPPSIIARILEEDTKSDIYFIGIQPFSMDYGENISEEVKIAADLIVECINNNS